MSRLSGSVLQGSVLKGSVLKGCVLHVSVPAKVILFGEYWVLRDVPAVGASLQESHHLTFQRCQEKDRNFRIESEAEYDLTESERIFEPIWDQVKQSCDLPPRLGVVISHRAGFPAHYGWGGSCALTLGLISYGRYVSGQSLDREDLWNHYRTLKLRYQWVGSGHDVFCQLKGGAWIPYRQMQNWEEGDKIEAGATDFEKFLGEYPLFFVPTFQKTSSLQAALQFMRLNISDADLEQARSGLQETYQAIRECDFEKFATCVHRTTEGLISKVPASLRYLELLRQQGDSFVCKSCGALGGDGLLLWIDKKRSAEALAQLSEQDIFPMFLNFGGQFDWSLEKKSSIKPHPIWH